MAEDRTFAVGYAAIGRQQERLIETPAETKGSRSWVTWGERNTYPQYIKGLCHTVPTLRTITLGLVDYVCGNAVNVAAGLPGRKPGTFDRRGTTGASLVGATATNVCHLGGIFWKVTLNNDYTIGEIESIPGERIRMDEDAQGFWYSENWGKGYGADPIFYPAWMPGTVVKETIYFRKIWGEGTYPEPVFAASVKACETERAIDDYHLGNIERGFMGSYLVNFNGGIIPTDEQKKEVERNFTQKFGGHRNAGRIMFSWNRNRDAMTTLQKMEVSDYGEKYETLSKHCRQQIFTAFRANPNLFGVATESSGFNSEEYEASFKLFNRTMVKPIQAHICTALEEVTGMPGIVSIEPFTLEGGEQKI